MDKFTIHCTKEQTKKALKLGAPIIVTPEEYKEDAIHFQMYLNGENASIVLPTAEQMIGFITEKNPTLVMQLADLIKSLGYKEGCLTFIDNYLNDSVERSNPNLKSCSNCVFSVNNDHCGLRGFIAEDRFPHNNCTSWNNEKPSGFELQNDGFFSWINTQKE